MVADGWRVTQSGRVPDRAHQMGRADSRQQRRGHRGAPAVALGMWHDPSERHVGAAMTRVSTS